MKHISSTQNPIYKNLKALVTTAKARREQKQAIIEGIHLAESYLQTGKLPISCIVSGSGYENDEVKTIVETCEEAGVQILVITEEQFRALSVVENGVSIFFVIEQPSVPVSAELKESAVLLDGVQDPGNVGAILRTAAAAGVTTVYCSPHTASVWSPRVLRAGMGAHFGLSIHEGADLKGLIESAAIPVLATTLQATQTIYETDLSKPAAWIIGNEGQGVSDDLLTSSVQQVIIPQNHGVESLNVAAATAVCLFEQRRQLNG